MNDEQWALEPHAFAYSPPTDEQKVEIQAEVEYWQQVIDTGGGPFPPTAFLKLSRARGQQMDVHHMRQVPYKDRLPWWATTEEPK